MQSNIYQQQGRDHYKRGEYQKALECFDRAIGRAVTVQLLDNRAACNARLNDFPTALKDAKKAINLAREDPTGYLRAGKVLLSMDRKSVALKIYAHGLKSVKHVGQGYEALRKAYGELLSELAPPKSLDPFTVLPREIAINVLMFLDFRDRTAIMRTSKQWRNFIRSEANFWTNLDFSKARRKKVRTTFIAMAINTAGRKIRQATITGKNYNVEKVLGALARQTTLEKLVLPDILRFDQATVDALKPAKHLDHIFIGSETEIARSALNTFFDHFTPQLKHVELDQSNSRDSGRNAPPIPTFDVSGLLTLHVKAWSAILPEFMAAPNKIASLQSLSMCLHHVPPRPLYDLDFRQCADLRYLCLHTDDPAIKQLHFPPNVEILKLGGKFRCIGAHMADALAIPYRIFLPKLVEMELDHGYWALSDLLATLDQRQTETNSTGCVTMPLRKLTLHMPLVPEHSPYRLEISDVDLRANVRLDALEHLAILAASELQDNQLIDLVKCAPNLKSLDVGRSRVSGIALKTVIEMRDLKELRVGPSPEWPRDAVEWARARGVHVHVTPYMEPKPSISHVPRRSAFPF
jgi:hypothetical protein